MKTNAMTTHTTLSNLASAEGTAPDQILQIALAAWRQENFGEVVEQFSDEFTFTDHALELEFKDKGRLIEFLAKISECFPDSDRKADSIFSSADRAVVEWTFTATKAEPFIGGRTRKVPICEQGVSVLRIKNGKISQWSDYYDRLNSRREGLAAWFTEWIEL